MGNPHIVWGVDPGTRGAICAVRRADPTYHVRTVAVPHRYEQKTGKAPAPVVDADKLIGEVGNLSAEFPPDLIVFEKVSAMPKQGVVSMFKFGWATGLIEGIIRACLRGKAEPEWLFLPPFSWKATLGLTDKNASKWDRKQKSVERANWLIVDTGMEVLPFHGRESDVAEAFLLACFGHDKLLRKLREYGKEDREKFGRYPQPVSLI